MGNFAIGKIQDFGTMKQLELIHKYGVPAVLFIWLGTVQYQTTSIQSRLDDCNEKRFQELKEIRWQSESSVTTYNKLAAVLPRKILVVIKSEPNKS